MVANSASGRLARLEVDDDHADAAPVGSTCRRPAGRPRSCRRRTWPRRRAVPASTAAILSRRSLVALPPDGVLQLLLRVGHHAGRGGDHQQVPLGRVAVERAGGARLVLHGLLHLGDQPVGDRLQRRIGHLRATGQGGRGGDRRVDGVHRLLDVVLEGEGGDGGATEAEHQQHGQHDQDDLDRGPLLDRRRGRAGVRRRAEGVRLLRWRVAALGRTAVLRGSVRTGRGLGHEVDSRTSWVRPDDLSQRDRQPSPRSTAPPLCADRGRRGGRPASRRVRAGDGARSGGGHGGGGHPVHVDRVTAARRISPASRSGPGWRRIRTSPWPPRRST